jgi:putative ABC transport system ATP-binding protein
MSELLRLSRVSKRYRRGSQELRVLEHADLEVRAGEVVGVLGTRGQGKTTLLRIAAGMESADEGFVCFEGQDLAALSDRELSRLLGTRIAWAGKSGPWMRMRMLDYVALPLLVRHGETKSGIGARLRGSGRRDGAARAYTRARDALERVGAPGCAEQEWDSLSDWERALVEVAQAIAREPALMLVDDLTDTLGIRETDELTSLLRALSRELGAGVLMSVSDAQATLWSDQVVTLAGGRLTQSAPAPGDNVIEFPEVGSQRRGTIS